VAGVVVQDASLQQKWIHVNQQSLVLGLIPADVAQDVQSKAVLQIALQLQAVAGATVHRPVYLVTTLLSVPVVRFALEISSSGLQRVSAHIRYQI
jgi:hypothetical protein